MQRRRRILQLFSRYLQYGGEEDSVYRIGDVLQRHHDVEYFIASTEEMLRQPKWLLPLLGYHNFQVLERLAKYQQVGKFDFWQIHNVFPAISPGAYAVAKKLGVPIIHYLHNYRMGCVNGLEFTRGEECRKCSGGNFIHGAMGKCWRESYVQSSVMAMIMTAVRRGGLFDQVRRWVAISEAQKQLHIEMGLPAGKIEVVHHFLKGDPAVQPPEFPADGYALFIGRLSAEKGVSQLLQAWAKLGKNRRLVIAGDGPEMAALQCQALQLGLTQVSFAGFVKRADQSALWAGAAFSIVPSIWQEPFGMVVLEAWAKARPVVAHRIGALPEIITHGENGFLADPYDPDDLAAALEEAFLSPARLREMGLNGRERLLSYFTEARWLRDIEEVYQHAELIPT